MHAFISYPTGSLHELGPLQISTLRNSLNGSHSLPEQLILLSEHSPLPLSLIVSEDIFHVESIMVFLRSAVEGSDDLGSLHAFEEETVFQTLFELHDLNIILVSNSGDLLEMGIFENGMSLSKEVIDDEDALLFTS